MGSSTWTRRDFVAALAALPAVFKGDPYRPAVGSSLVGGAVRVRGRVMSLGRGLARVGVSDGLTVVRTDPDGRFDLVTDATRRYLSLSAPAGYQLPISATGTIKSFLPIAADRRGEMVAAFNLTPIPEGDERHAFLLLADIQTQDAADMDHFRRETLPDLSATLKGLSGVPAFGVGDGDIMWDRLALYDDYEAMVKQLGIPFVQVVGNHDLDLGEQTDEGSTTTFERCFGPRYHSFNRGQVHYVVLDDVFYYGGGYLGYLDRDQLTWLANDLALVEKGSPVVVFTHIPLMSAFPTRQGTKTPPVANYVVNRELAYRLLAPYQTTILTGHIHESAIGHDGGVTERNHGAVCGGWWTGDICYDGTPNGYGVYQVDGSEIRWRHQATGQPATHQIRGYPRGADPTAPEEIVANVWAHEPGWKVLWYEEGVAKGAMAQRIGLDPLAVERLAGDQLPAKRPWVDPVRTGHLFYARPSATAGQIRVEATDPWGRTFVDDVR